MSDGVVCPYYGKNDDDCDVGCGYISPHDVDMIIRYCSCYYAGCPKYQELAERRPRNERPQAASDQTLAATCAAGKAKSRQGRAGAPGKLFKVKWPLPYLLNYVAMFSSENFTSPLGEAPVMTRQPSGDTMTLSDTTANPAPLGLIGFGMTTVMLNLANVGFFTLGSMVLAMGIFYGGLGQILVGIMEWRKNNTFGATAFTSYGLFWLTFVGLIVLPRTGLKIASPQAPAMVAFLFMWGLFTLVLFIGTFRLNRALQIVFGSLTLLFFLLALGEATGNTLIRAIAGYEGIVCGLAAMYAGFAQILNELFERTVCPLGAVPKSP